MTNVVVCTDRSGKDPHRQAGVDRVVISGSLGVVMVSALTWNARNMGSSPPLGTIFPIFHHTHDTGCHDPDPVQATHCMVVKPTLCMFVRSRLVCCIKL